MSLLRIVILGCSMFAAYPTFAQDQRWWSTGHEYITRHAVAHLPQPLRGFMVEHRDLVGMYSASEPPGQHWIDIDFYPEFFAGTFPRALDDLVALYGWPTVSRYGTGPWNAEDYATQLTDAMATAGTSGGWYATLLSAGPLAHYVADLHNPLHMTLNYNGQLTGNDGIHARYEGEMIARHVPGGLPIVPAPDQCVYLPDVATAILDEIDVSFWYSYDIMSADDLAVAADPSYGQTYYGVLWAETGPFTQALFQEASEMIASAWFSAWVDAGRPVPRLPAYGDMNCDDVVDMDDVNPFVEAVIDSAGYEAGYADCNWLRGDVNQDGRVDFDDINPFVTLLLGKR